MLCLFLFMFQQLQRLASRHYRMRDLKLAARRSASGYRQGKKKNNKPRADYEKRSAHGRAVKKTEGRL